MRRIIFALFGLGAVFLASGCTTANSDKWNWPWSTPSALSEDYTQPPMGDYRYSEPARLPKSVMKPGLPTRETTTDKSRAGFGAPGPGMGAMPRPGPGGGFSY